ncbi:MAG: M48 family metallopeptidase [Nitrososphaerales archaeon]
MELRCKLCGTYSDEENIFCRGCGVRLLQSRRYDLNRLDYAYEADLEKLALLKELATPAALIKAFYLKKAVSMFVKEVSARSTLVERSSKLGSMLVKCADTLCIKYLPKMYVNRYIGYNAYSFGFDEKPYIVVGERLLKILTEEEMTALIAHELGHIGCGHMLYHTLAEFIVQGVGWSAATLGIPIIEAPLRLALLSWRRESEVSADRASLLVAERVEAVKSLLQKLTLLNNKTDHRNEVLESLSELVSTHPHLARRIALVEEYHQSVEYSKARSKISTRNLVRRALLPICRFCGAKKHPSSLFCSSCGRSCV